MSRANTRTRRSTWKADLTELNTVKVAGREIRVPRRLAKAYKNAPLRVRGAPPAPARARAGRPGPLSCPRSATVHPGV